MRRQFGPPPTPLDLVLAGALTLASQVEIWAPHLMLGVGDITGDRTTLSATTLLMTLPLVWRRTAPLAVLVSALAAGLVQQALTTPNQGLSTLAGLMVAAYSASAYAGPRAAVAAGVTIGLGSAALGEDAADSAFVALVLGLAWGVGLVAGRRGEQIARLTHDNRDLAESLTEAADRLAAAQRRPEGLAHREKPGQMAGLTPRELEVVQAIALGMSNSEIAGYLVISEWTVKTHVASVLRKLGLRDRAQVVVAAYESGVVSPGARSPDSETTSPPASAAGGDPHPELPRPGGSSL